MRIPARGIDKSELFSRLEAARQHDWPWREGKLFAYVFEDGPEIEEVGKKAYMAYLTENGLDPTTFPSLLQFENDVVDMARRHLGGDDHVVGNFTSGGTESIILAVKTARDWFRAKHPGVRPEMLVPITAHAAFHKAAHYLDVDAIITDVDPTSFRADPASMRAHLSDRTMLLVASACSYAHGVVDPVREIAQMAAEKGALCHVDGCMGGFLLPYFRRLGATITDFDFTVPGVTSMSMDLHKYGLCPKGASVVLYRDESLRKHQIYTCSEWTGYTMINNTIQSSKSGGPLAAAWAVLQFVGEAGYQSIAERLLDAKRRLVAGIRAVPGLSVLGEPEMSLVGFTSEEVSVFALADELKSRGWHVQAQLAHGPSRENLHMTINPGNTRWIDDFVAELPRAVEAVRAAGGGPKPPKELAALLAAQIESDPTGEGLGNVVDSVVGSGGGVPGKMAEVNALLNELPRKVQEKLLVAFVGKMFTPKAEG
jgi:glutamate/tyrosine decarboxylase-like PLP-dependent enzyme